MIDDADCLFHLCLCLDLHDIQAVMCCSSARESLFSPIVKSSHFWFIRCQNLYPSLILDPQLTDDWKLFYLTYQLQLDVIAAALSPEKIVGLMGTSSVASDAYRFGHVELVKILLADRRVDPNEPNGTPLRTVCKNNYPRVLRLLLAHPWIKTSESGEELNLALQNKSIACIKVLLQDARYSPVMISNSLLKRQAIVTAHPELEPFLDVRGYEVKIRPIARRVAKSSLSACIDTLTSLQQDTLLSICLRLNMTEMHNLSYVSSNIRVRVIRFALLPYFWYSQIQQLTEVRLPSYQRSHEEWKRTYHLVSRALDSERPMSIAIKDELSTRLLIDMSHDPSEDKNWALCAACTDGYTETVELLLADKRVDPRKTEICVLRIACQRQHEEIVRLLLDDGRIDPSRDESKCLRETAETGNLAIMRMLLADGRADPTVRRNWSLDEAERIGDLEMMDLLLFDARVQEMEELLRIERGDELDDDEIQTDRMMRIEAS